MTRKLAKDESIYHLQVYDKDPHKGRMGQLLDQLKLSGRDFGARRRYKYHISYRVILTKDVVTFIFLTYGDIIQPRVIS